MLPPIITLTTDFGTRDSYVAAMKGVILGISPHATIVDISHDVPAQDISHGAFILGTAYGYFPIGTIHIAVVDPGVGTSRRAVLLVAQQGLFVAPDNGLLSYVAMARSGQAPRHVSSECPSIPFGEPVTVPVPEGCSAFALTHPEFWRHPVSDTFHGRDVFAPVAAHLSLKTPPESFGEQVDEIVCLNILQPEIGEDTICGHIVHVDGFGNLVSNIAAADFPGGEVEVQIAGRRIKGLSLAFASRVGLCALVGGHGRLEVALRDGSAAAELGAAVGTEIRVLARRNRRAG